MGANTFFIVTGVIFGLMAAAQVARLEFQWSVRIASLEIPPAVSWIVLLVAGGLCAWAFQLASF